MYRRTLFLLAALIFAQGNEILSEKPRINGRIVGGEEAKIEDFRHQVSVLVDGKPYCGGSIIKSDVIITAAGCVVSQIYAFTIKYGSSNIDDGKSVGVKRVLLHPKFSFATTDYNVALVYLEREIPFDRSARPITLASKAPAPNSPVVVTGWGDTKESDYHSASTVLRRVDVVIFAQSVCIAQYGERITDRMFCAGVDGGGTDACRGDLGGALISGNALVGIVSWGYGCGRPEYFGVYTNVTEMRPWIVENAGMQSGSPRL